MSVELLKIDRFPTISELSFLLLKVLGNGLPIPQYDLGYLCKNTSLSLALSFENSISFLSSLSVIKIHEDERISCIIEESQLEGLKGEHSLCVFITKKLVNFLIENGLLAKVFNNRIVKFDIYKDTFSINSNAIPLEFPMIKHYLINMGIAQPVEHSKGRIFILPVYKHFFQIEILQKVFDDAQEALLDPFSDQIIKSKMTQRNIFISYSHADENYKNELVKHLSGLRRMGIINEWNDRKILPGEEWDKEIKNKLDLAEIILFLVSSDFMASDYINDVEISRTIMRHNNNEALIIPIILRPCDFASLPISKHQALPKNAKPISRWDDKDEAFLDVVNSLKKIVQK